MLATVQIEPGISLYNIEFEPSKPVILAAWAASMAGIKDLDPTIDIWTCNVGYMFMPRPIAALIEIHPWSYLTDHNYQATKELAAESIAWLKQSHGIPIYMIEAIPEVPDAVRFPIEDALELAGNRYFSSSFAYMMALALLHKRNPIYVYGFNMAFGTEYEYQRPNAEWWIGYAQGRGFDVVISPDSPLCKVKQMYGYEGGEMIDRQKVEAIYASIVEQQSEQKRLTEYWEGVYAERERAHAARPLKEEAGNTVREYERRLHETIGALTVLQFLIDDCDLIPAEIPNFGKDAGGKRNA